MNESRHTDRGHELEGKKMKLFFLLSLSMIHLVRGGGGGGKRKKGEGGGGGGKKKGCGVTPPFFF